MKLEKKLDLALQRKIIDVISKNLEIDELGVEVTYYKKTESCTELKLEASKNITDNFIFRVEFYLSEYEDTIITLKTFVSRIVPVSLIGQNIRDDIVNNIIQEFFKKSFYTDLFQEYNLKYQEISKKIYENIEILFAM